MMLRSFFLWFYCLPISKALVLIVMVSAVYLMLRQWLSGKRFWRPVIALLFLVWLAVIAAATLTGRTSDMIPAGPELIPFHSYRAVLAGENKEILRSNFMNMVLFYPAGLLACELLPGRWSRAGKVLLITALFAVVSAVIEFCQYRFALGQAEIDDVLHNALGALLGGCAAALTVAVKKPPGK